MLGKRKALRESNGKAAVPSVPLRFLPATAGTVPLIRSAGIRINRRDLPTVKQIIRELLPFHRSSAHIGADDKFSAEVTGPLSYLHQEYI